MKASVVLVTYRRLERLKMIVDAWLSQTDDFWLCDCSKKGIPFPHKDFNYVRFSPDPGSKVRHAVATLTQGDIVIKADDDILPKPGLVDDFKEWHEILEDAILGVHGRIFDGEDYYRDTNLIGAKKLIEPKRVDFLGVMTCSPRKYLAMDLRGCLTPIEDLYWHNNKYPKAPKFVIPTKNFNNRLPESKDAQRLCGNQEMRKIRRDYYRKVYLRHYR